MRNTLVIIALAGIVFVPVTFARAQVAEDTRVTSAIGVLDAWIQSRMAYRDIPGLTIGIVHDQEIILERGYGHADREGRHPATPGTLFRIASISKLFTSIAVMHLVEEGKVRLDDPVSDYLEWFQPADTPPDAPPITLRHLMTHTSGLPRESPFPYWTDFDFPTREELIAAFPKQIAVFPPSVRSKYSNLGLTIVGEVVQAVSDMPYEDYVTTRILEPLGMADTVVSINENNWNLAIGYGRRMPDGTREIMPFTDSKGLTPAANFSSTIEDFTRFAMWQFRLRETDGTEVLKGYTLREMQRPQWVDPSWTSGRGLGFAISHTPERDYVGHGGYVYGYTSQFSMSPKEKIAVTVFTNADDAGPGAVLKTAFDILSPAIKAALSEDPAPPEPDPSFKPLMGLYRDLGGDAFVTVFNGSLVVFNPTADKPLDAMTVLEPLGNLTFKIVDDGFGPVGETVRFEIERGRVERMWIGENYMEPVR